MKRTILSLTALLIILCQSELKADPSSISAYGFVIKFNEICKDLRANVNLRLDDNETVEDDTYKKEMFIDEAAAFGLTTLKATNSLTEVAIFADVRHKRFTLVNYVAIETMEGIRFGEEEINKYKSLLKFDDPDSLYTTIEFETDVAEYSKLYDDTYGYRLFIRPKSR